MVQSHYTAPMVQTAFRSTAFKGSCASPVHSHLGNDTVINCYGAQALSANSAGGFTPTMTDASTAANCAGSSAAQSWFVFSETLLSGTCKCALRLHSQTTRSCPDGRFSWG